MEVHENKSRICSKCHLNKHDLMVVLKHLKLPKIFQATPTGLKSNIDGSAAEGNDTVEVVVLAANGLVGALSGSKTNDGNGVAGEAHIGSNIADGDVQET